MPTQAALSLSHTPRVRHTVTRTAGRPTRIVAPAALKSTAPGVRRAAPRTAAARAF